MPIAPEFELAGMKKVSEDMKILKDKFIVDSNKSKLSI